MTNVPVYQQARRIEETVLKAVATIDLYESDKRGRELVKHLQHDASDARQDIRDYELAETRAEQAKLGTAARERLASLRDNILQASQYNVFNAVDVAEISAK